MNGERENELKKTFSDRLADALKTGIDLFVTSQMVSETTQPRKKQRIFRSYDISATVSINFT
jgi:hypothetical protein